MTPTPPSVRDCQCSVGTDRCYIAARAATRDGIMMYRLLFGRSPLALSKHNGRRGWICESDCSPLKLLRFLERVSLFVYSPCVLASSHYAKRAAAVYAATGVSSPPSSRTFSSASTRTDAPAPGLTASVARWRRNARAPGTPWKAPRT